MEVWLSSSFPPVDLEAADKLLGSPNQKNQASIGPRPDTASSDYHIPSPAVSRPASVTQSNPASDVSSMWSSSSTTSQTSSHRGSRRRGRRREHISKPHISKPDVAVLDGNVGEKWFCTFLCGKTFKSLYEWKRHEGPIHKPREAWICGIDILKDPTFCLTCPDFTVLRNHKHDTLGRDACCRKPEGDRIFFRRDQFTKHLHTVHLHNSKHPDARHGCKTTTMGCGRIVRESHMIYPPLPEDDPALHCGFCGAWLVTWEQRCDHVADHLNHESHTDSSKWWPERKLCDLRRSAPDVNVDTHCRFCKRNLEDHRSPYVCEVWSCRFLQGPGVLEAFRDICLDSNSGVDRNLSDLMKNCRSCDQELFYSADAFAGHLVLDHNIKVSSDLQLFNLVIGMLYRGLFSMD